MQGYAAALAYSAASQKLFALVTNDTKGYCPCSVAVIDAATDTVTATVGITDINLVTAGSIAVDDANGRVMVGGGGPMNASPAMLAIDQTTLKPSAAWPISKVCGAKLTGLAVDKTGKKVFGACSGGAVGIIDESTQSVFATATPGNSPGGQSFAVDEAAGAVYELTYNGATTVKALKMADLSALPPPPPFSISGTGAQVVAWKGIPLVLSRELTQYQSYLNDNMLQKGLIGTTLVRVGDGTARILGGQQSAAGGGNVEVIWWDVVVDPKGNVGAATMPTTIPVTSSGAGPVGAIVGSANDVYFTLGDLAGGLVDKNVYRTTPMP